MGADGELVAAGASSNGTGGAEEREMGPAVRFGVTEPISLGLPTQAENALHEQLMEEIRRDAPLESDETMRFRASVLLELSRIVRQWVYEVSVQQGLDEESAKTAGAKIFTFGSYRLGLISPGSDIDALCVAPKHITRDAFFQVLVPKLEEHPDVSDLTPVPDAYTPIIKLKLSGIEIDLLFARLSLTQIPEDMQSLNDDNLLKNLDDKTVRSLNGCRVADHILALVPDAERFRDALRLIKIWAKRRGIYSNVLGFYGGITWAILMARVCQLYPYYTGAALVKRFFRLYDRWNWKNPVCLTHIVEMSNTPGLMAFKIWNPKVYPQDRLHLMPIITPAFPCMNSTHNVSETTKRILAEEFARGCRVTEQVEQGRCRWSEVYKPLPFFSQHKHYLHIEVLAKSAQVHTKWSGWIESKLRQLVKNLEQIPTVQVRPWPNHLAFEDSEWPHALAMFIGLTISKVGGRQGHSVDLRKPVTHFVEIINSWPDKAQHANQHEMRIRDVSRRDLPSYVPQDRQKPLRDKSDNSMDASLALAAEAAAEGAKLPAPTPANNGELGVIQQSEQAEASSKKRRIEHAAPAASPGAAEGTKLAAPAPAAVPRVPGPQIPATATRPLLNAGGAAASTSQASLKRKLGKIVVKLD
eukprot:TRINITY_DN73178_c0_g1_i1.p1 TRINITY_DN73178_c0_g1~~TRINITY_DN73178_c0_g1_i1.p1  ORF type:complete len:640 (+),score=86.99 TRINITY_DN73178_c0_g1_i1:29-1948(+)